MGKHLICQTITPMKKTCFLFLLPLFSTCTTPIGGLIGDLKMYTDTWPSPTDTPTITDSSGYKIIDITSHVSAKEAPLIVSSSRLIATLRGMAIQECILPNVGPGKYFAVRFRFLVNGREYREVYTFFDSADHFTIAKKARIFFASIGAGCGTYKGDHDSTHIHFAVKWLKEMPLRELQHVTTPIGLFTRYWVLEDSARFFSKMSLHYFNTDARFPPTTIYPLQDDRMVRHQ